MSDQDLTPEEIAAAESLVEPILYGSGGGNEYERLPTIQEIALRLRALRAEFERENARLREAVDSVAFLMVTHSHLWNPTIAHAWMLMHRDDLPQTKTARTA